MNFLFFVSAVIINLSFNPSINQFSQSNDSSPDSLQYYVVPVNYAGTQGTASFLGPLSNAQRTYQFLINENQLSDLAGKQITGITYRLLASASANWPASDITFTNYDIYLSGSVAPSDKSLTFSQNIVGTQKQVRSGSLTVIAGSFPFGGSPTQFGTNIAFDSAYNYSGGHLLIDLRHTGFTGTSSSVDAIGTSTSGYGTLFSACWTGSYTGTSGVQGNFAVIRLKSETLVGIGSSIEIPGDFHLNQNFPNPFNPATTIKFVLAKSSNVKIVIYDVFGREVQTIVNNKYNKGEYEISWDAAKFASGVYFYKMNADNYVNVKKMILIK